MKFPPMHWRSFGLIAKLRHPLLTQLMVVNIWPRQFNTALCCVAWVIGKILKVTHFLCYFQYPTQHASKCASSPSSDQQTLSRLWERSLETVEPFWDLFVFREWAVTFNMLVSLGEENWSYFNPNSFLNLIAKECRRIFLVTLESLWPSFYFLFFFAPSE